MIPNPTPNLLDGSNTTPEVLADLDRVRRFIAEQRAIELQKIEDVRLAQVAELRAFEAKQAAEAAARQAERDATDPFILALEAVMAVALAHPSFRQDAVNEARKLIQTLKQQAR